MKRDVKGVPREFAALGEVLSALRNLDATQRNWVIASAVSNLGITATAVNSATSVGGGDGTNLRPYISGTPGTKEHAKAFLRLKSPKKGCPARCMLGLLSREI